MIIKRTITEYLDLDKFRWQEDFMCWLNYSNLTVSEDLTEDIFAEFVLDNYSNFFESDEEEIELYDSTFEDIEEDFLNYFDND